MTVQIYPSILSGEIHAIPSKSELHRILICAAFSDAPTEILVPGPAYSSEDGIPDDILATTGCLRELGASITFTPNRFSVRPAETINPSPLLNCHESGSTLRFLLPVAAAVSRAPSFTGSGRLPERPIGDLLSALEEHGITHSSASLPLKLSGTMVHGTYHVSGDVSSQYLTGLLLSLPLSDGCSDILLTTPLRSGSYIDITLGVMRTFGVSVQVKGNRYELSGSGPLRYHSPGTITVGGDWSNTAAFLAAGCLGTGNCIQINNLDVSSLQGDRKVLSLLEKMGAAFTCSDGSVICSSAKLRGCEIDIDPTPDLMPVLAAAAAGASGDTCFINASRLRQKESDRIRSTEILVNSLGGDACSSSDSLTVHGTGDLTGGTAEAFNDHRIVMAAAIASCISQQPIVIHGAEAIRKSYPTFFEDFASLGGKYHVI